MSQVFGILIAPQVGSNGDEPYKCGATIFCHLEDDAGGIAPRFSPTNLSPMYSYYKLFRILSATPKRTRFSGFTLFFSASLTDEDYSSQ